MLRPGVRLERVQQMHLLRTLSFVDLLWRVWLPRLERHVVGADELILHWLALVFDRSLNFQIDSGVFLGSITMLNFGNIWDVQVFKRADQISVQIGIVFRSLQILITALFIYLSLLRVILYKYRCHRQILFIDRFWRDRLKQFIWLLTQFFHILHVRQALNLIQFLAHEYLSLHRIF